MWFHQLDCGHEHPARRRLPNATEIDCSGCVADAEAARRLADLPAEPQIVPPPQPVTEFWAEDLVSTEAEALEQAARWRAQIASKLGIPLEAVEIAVAGDRILGGSVFLDPTSLAKLVHGLTSG